MDRNVNWTDNASRTAQTNTLEAHFLTSQMWMNEFNNSIEGTGVEIIELDSQNSSRSEEDPYENIQNLSHAWSYVNASRFQELENRFKVNRQARLRRRLRNRNNSANDSSENEFDDSFYFNNTDTSDDFVTLNQQTNCFTIFDKHSALQLNSSLDSSGDGDIEEARCCDVLEQECNGDVECEEIVTFSNSDQDKEKRTIWIYSFKNRRLLSENDFELVNIPSQSVSCTDSTSCSPECIEEFSTENITRVGRVASPIPKTFIPRLDLSLAATLPNVSEVSEPKSSQTLDGSKDTPILQKPFNGWFSDSTKKTAVSTQDQSTNIIDWMALSPRERRRRSRHTNLDMQNVAKLLPVPETMTHSEKSQDIEHIEVEIIEDVISRAPSQMNSQRTDQTGGQNNDTTMGDRGDYNKCVQRPHIKIDHKPSTAPGPITEPIEKLDSQNWIAEYETLRPKHDELIGNKDNEEASVEFDLSSAGDRLMARNMSLLKPAEWREYSPIAGSLLSIQLSLGADSDAEKSLLQRCVSCFKCCKYRFQ